MYWEGVPVKEPHLTEFKRLIRGGAASIDVHDARSGAHFATDDDAADEEYVTREVERVALHQRSLAPLLEEAVGTADRILDFGCGTGGTTVALALSRLGASRVVGVDANARAVEAARVRAAGYDLTPPRVELQHVAAGQPLPFADDSFDLVVTVSVLEFITDAGQRNRAVSELRRVVRPGGFLYISTPRLGLRQYHSGKLLGDFVHEDGMPWSSSFRETAHWGDGWERVPLHYQVDQLAQRVPWVPRPVLERGLGWVLPYAARWQKILLHRPTTNGHH
jgi:SAM-dependent methyltransferase